MEFMDGLSTGVILMLLFYCKITYFVAGAGSFAAGWMMIKPSRYRFTAFGIGAILCFLIFQLAFRIHMGNYLADIQTAAQSQSFDERFSNLLGSLRENSFLLYLTFLLLFLYSVVMTESRISRAELRTVAGLWVVAILVVGSGLVITTGNTREGNDIPFYFIFCLILLNTLTGRPIEIIPASTPAFRVVVLLVIMVMLPIFYGYLVGKDVASIAYSAWWNRVQLPSLHPEQRFHSDTMGDFIIPENSYWTTAYSYARDVPKTINDGLQLVERHIQDDTRIFCLCLTDPFSYALGQSPAKGTPLWWDENISFSASIHPDSEILFRNVDFVVMPVIDEDNAGCCGNTVLSMEQIYGGFLENYFFETDRSTYWILLERKSSK
jgi:hypothetical protein